MGAYSNTFNTPGVKEHGIFLKDISDAKKIRSRVLECKWFLTSPPPLFNGSCFCKKGFEYAAQPNVTEAEKSAKLHFAVVGGGPTVS